ncbi:M15 family metallopeptidase [Patescibacteria group bacterium]|nr:M15 family metallopeptidase [Patescibacteria group bacterium]
MQRSYLVYALGVITLTLAVTTTYLTWQHLTQRSHIDMLLKERNFFLLENASSSNTLVVERAQASSTITDLAYRLSITEEELRETERDLDREQNRNEEFEDQLDDLAGTIGVLDKLSKTDKELLQKYSKVYFLNENYIPQRLTKIDDSYVLPGRKEQYFHASAWKFLKEMLDDAADDAIDLKVVSAYRSFDEQNELKGQYTQQYGTGANAFSADQGFSEHQLGTTLDLTTPAVGGPYTSFAATPAYTWLQENAHKYGFILSYPENNSFYVYEPWHWRFVGEDLARDLHAADVHFYDWEQRKIDEYLVSIFD